jgi:hypothetical protein
MNLGPMMEWLPKGAIDHDHKAYLKKTSAAERIKAVG